MINREDLDPDMLMIDDCDTALIGTTYRDGLTLSVYSYSKLVAHYIEEFSHCDDADEMAMEYVDYNIIGAYVGERTPVIVYDLPWWARLHMTNCTSGL